MSAWNFERKPTDRILGGELEDPEDDEAEDDDDVGVSIRVVQPVFLVKLAAGDDTRLDGFGTLSSCAVTHLPLLYYGPRGVPQAYAIYFS